MKGYWISSYRSIKDPAKLAAYAEIAGPAIRAAGGRFIARGGRVKAFETGVKERTVLIESDSFDDALKAYQSPAYREALVALDDGVERDVRIVEGVG